MTNVKLYGYDALKFTLDGDKVKITIQGNEKVFESQDEYFKWLVTDEEQRRRNLICSANWRRNNKERANKIQQESRRRKNGYYERLKEKEELIEQAKMYREQGYSYEKIGYKLGYTGAAVRRWLTKEK